MISVKSKNSPLILIKAHSSLRQELQRLYPNWILIKTTENETLSGVVTFYAMKSGAPDSSRPAG